MRRGAHTHTRTHHPWPWHFNWNPWKATRGEYKVVIGHPCVCENPSRPRGRTTEQSLRWAVTLSPPSFQSLDAFCSCGNGSRERNKLYEQTPPGIRWSICHHCMYELDVIIHMLMWECARHVSLDHDRIAIDICFKWNKIQPYLERVV